MMNELLIVFGLTGFIFVPLIITFLVCGVDKAHKIGGAIAVTIFWIAFALIMFCEAEANENAWNDGFCECGTHWELKGVSKTLGDRTKYYACPDCYTEIEIHN